MGRHYRKNPKAIRTMKTATILHENKGSMTILRSFDGLSHDPPWSERNRGLLMYLGLICVGLFGLDYATGPTIQEPYIYVLLVILSAWFLGSRVGYILGIILPLSRIVAHLFWVSPLPLMEVLVNAIIQIATLVIVVYLMTRIKDLGREVRALKGSLPICIHCKKIRNHRDEWEQLEAYISRQSEMKFTHGICPACNMEQRIAKSA